MASILNATTSSGLVTSADNSGSLQLATNNGTTALTIDTSQNVGIGTSSPSTPLNIVRNAAGAQKVLFSNNSSGSTAETAFSVFNGTAEASLRVAGSSYGGYGAYTANNTLVYNDTSAITIMADNASNGIIKFAAGGNTERMRINSGGALLIGNTATSPATADAYGVTINSNTSGNFSQGIIQASANGSASLLLNRGSDNGNVALFYRSAVNVGSISVTSSATAFNTSSDYRLKENIAPMTGALAKVSQLKPVTYKWKIDGSDGQGFIAHELQAVIPEAVVGEKDAVETYTDEDGNEQTRIKPQGIDTSFLVATLTAALQEAHGLIKDLQARVETLEAK